MSADNYLLVRKHPRGGYGVVMGFASDEEDPVLDPLAPGYDTVPEALAAAFKEEREEIIEYGVSVHSEVGDDWVTAPLKSIKAGGVVHEDHIDYPPYCPKAPTVQVVAGPRMIQISADDLFGLLTKASNYHARFPYGIIPPHLWELLDDEQQERLTAFSTELAASGIAACDGDTHVLVGQKIGCACGMVKRR